MIFLIVCSTFTYAYSSGFLYMVEAMKIEKENVNGKMLNEDIYESYNLLVYGSPTEVKNSQQRFKNTENGKWTLNGGRWNGIGDRGEYLILGEDYSGRIVHNELFPDDYNSGTSPEKWNYREIKDAESSWNDTTKYQFEIQREYMMNQKLSRFGVIYDITAKDIGLNKAKVETYATWGSAGSIYTEKPGEGKVYWIATFSVPPMSANAELESILELPNGLTYTVPSDRSSIEIPLNFGAIVKNVSAYSRKEHVKIIEAELKVNGIARNITSAEKTFKVLEDDSILIDKRDYPNANSVILEVECNSILATCFPMDPVMYANTKAYVTVNFENEEENRVPIVNTEEGPAIYSIKVERLTTQRGQEKTVPLYMTRKGNFSFICAGQVIKVTVRASENTNKVTLDFSGSTSIQTLDDLTKKFLWDDPKSRGEKPMYSSLSKLKKSYSLPGRFTLESTRNGVKTFTKIYVIPYGTTQTLHSWNSLREESRDAFEINTSKLFTKKSDAYKLTVQATSPEGRRTKFVRLHVAERWDELYNRDISPYIKQF